ncbi:MAG: hypothetical protein SGPRY_013999, partial [Prymnesium sp.]
VLALSSDVGVIRAGTRCLDGFARRGALLCEKEGAVWAHTLLRLLRPELPGSAVACVPPLLSALRSHAPAAFAHFCERALVAVGAHLKRNVWFGVTEVGE